MKYYVIEGQAGTGKSTFAKNLIAGKGVSLSDCVWFQPGDNLFHLILSCDAKFIVIDDIKLSALDIASLEKTLSFFRCSCYFDWSTISKKIKRQCSCCLYSIWYWL